MKKFFNPDWRKLLLFGVLILIAVGGEIQAWAFDDEPQTKPPLYDLLRPYPFWLIWIFSTVPLLIISAPFRSIVQNLPDIFFRLWWIVLVIYYYLLSCSFFYLIDLFKSRISR